MAKPSKWLEVFLAQALAEYMKEPVTTEIPEVYKAKPIPAPPKPSHLSSAVDAAAKCGVTYEEIKAALDQPMYQDPVLTMIAGAPSYHYVIDEGKPTEMRGSGTVAKRPSIQMHTSEPNNKRRKIIGATVLIEYDEGEPDEIVITAPEEGLEHHAEYEWEGMHDPYMPHPQRLTRIKHTLRWTEIVDEQQEQ